MKYRMPSSSIRALTRHLSIIRGITLQHVFMATTRNPPNSQTYLDDFLIEAIGNFIRRSVVRLRNIVMQTISTSSEPLQSPLIEPQSKMPSLAVRRAACTHLTMERLQGDYHCDVCNRPSELGSVYLCIQDRKQHPTSNEGHEAGVGELDQRVSEKLTFENVRKLNTRHVDPPSSGSEEQTPESRMPTPELSPWIETAVREGQYTSEQVAFLQAQKQKVVDTANAAVFSFEEERSKDHTAIQRPSDTTDSGSADTNPHAPDPTITKAHQTSLHGPLPAAISKQPKLKMFPFCEFRSCQACRPTYRDRAWLSFDTIFASEGPGSSVDLFLEDQYDSRPLASASIMRSIGLRKPPPRVRPSLRTIDGRIRISFHNSDQPYFPNTASQYSVDLTNSVDLADDRVEPESRGFRESIKRAFRNMMLTRRDSSQFDTKRKSKEEVEKLDFDVDLWNRLNEVLLKEASSVPLPGHDGMDGLGGEIGEVDVAEGVAVTEESVGLGAADIIISV